MGRPHRLDHVSNAHALRQLGILRPYPALAPERHGGSLGQRGGRQQNGREGQGEKIMTGNYDKS